MLYPTKGFESLSYTCGIGVAAVAGGAKQVLNADFATTLSIGVANATLNEQSEPQFPYLQDDAMLVLRQFSGLRVEKPNDDSLPRDLPDCLTLWFWIHRVVPGHHRCCGYGE